MKNLILSLSIIWSLCLPSWADTYSGSGAGGYSVSNDFSRKASISVNPLGILINQWGGKVAVKIAPHMALTLPLSFYYWGFLRHTQPEFLLWGGSIGIGTRFFLSDEAFKTGWFVEPNAGVGYSKSVGEKNSIFIKLGLLGGYGWVWDSGFILNLGVGLNTFFHKPTSERNEWWIYPWPDFEASIGYSW